jgi:hypothetical protein
MILMVLDYPEEFVVDGLSEISIIDELYFISKDGSVFKSEEPFDPLSKFYEASRVFIPKSDALTKYEKVEVQNCVNKEQEVCKAKAVWYTRKGDVELIVIHPGCKAYLCNDNGKTIKKLV